MIFCMSSSIVYGEDNIKIDSIVIKQAPWHIETPAAVTCIGFENDISYKEYHISDSIIISDIVRELNCLRESKAKSLDVRCKIYFFSHGEIIWSACMDARRVLFDGALYTVSTLLKNTIDGITSKYNPKESSNKVYPIKRDIPFPNGRDSLYSYLSSELEDICKIIERPIKLGVNCLIDNHGNTVKVIIKNKDDSTSINEDNDIIARLSDVFINDIKWIPNKERFPFEAVSIPMSFIPERDSNEVLCSDTIYSMAEKDIAEDKSGVEYIWSLGKDAIPYLIDSIGSKRYTVIDFYCPIDSNLGNYYYPAGWKYVYLIDFILTKTSIDNLFDIKKLDSSEWGYSFDGWRGILSPYLINGCYDLLRVTPDPDSIVKVNTDDMTIIQKVYAEWWQKNKDKSLTEMRREWKNNPHILTNYGFAWR